MTAPYVPLDGRPWRLAMGLRPLDPAAWLEVDEARAAELEVKQALLESSHDRVVATLPGSEAAGAELLAAVVGHLAEHHPGLVTAGRTLEEHTTGARIDPAALHPVDAAARLVQEDLCVMESAGGRWVLTAASVCFPSRWNLRDKVGTSLTDIHAPVPGYAESLATPTAAFFDRLKVERPVWRLNWTLIDSPALHQPDPGERAAPWTDPATAWFRVERQTVRRLPATGAIVFTIRTYVTPLSQLATRPGVAAALAATLPTVPPATLAYKGWLGLVEPLLRGLGTSGAPGAS